MAVMTVAMSVYREIIGRQKSWMDEFDDPSFQLSTMFNPYLSWNSWDFSCIKKLFFLLMLSNRYCHFQPSHSAVTLNFAKDKWFMSSSTYLIQSSPYVTESIFGCLYRSAIACQWIWQQEVGSRTAESFCLIKITISQQKQKSLMYL